MGGDASRITTGICTLGISEGVRAIDEDTGKAMCRATPAGAIASAIQSGRVSDLDYVSGGLDTLAAATRNVPVVRDVTVGVANIEKTINPLTYVDTFVKHKKVTPNGWAYACAMASNIMYQPYGKRPSTYKDKEKDVWNELSKPYLKSLSYYDSEHMGAWRLNGKDTYIVAFRGTVMTSIEDDLDDLFIFGNIEDADSRWWKSKRFVESFKKKVKPRSLWITGHSLGGNLAFFCLEKNSDAKGHIFNAGAGFGYKWNKKDLRSRVTHHRIVGDPISQNYGVQAKIVEYMNSESWAHSMNNFIEKKDQFDE